MHRPPSGLKSAVAAPAPPASLDLTHLSQQTDGDLLLQKELLDIFRLRSPELIDQMFALASAPQQQGSPLRDLAHQLKGSALALGAFGVAAAAEAVEIAFGADTCDINPDSQPAAAGVEEPKRGARGEAALIALAAAFAQALAAIDAHFGTI
jgi:HPt (histidine-containing phosphotransfer) domain-containing protein